jgi:hypothetical protein
MVALFGSFGSKSLSAGGKLVCNIYGNSNSHQIDKLFFINLYKVYNLYILMDFYLVLFSQLHGCKVARPKTVHLSDDW